MSAKQLNSIFVMDALCPFIVGANGMIIIYISNPFLQLAAGVGTGAGYICTVTVVLTSRENDNDDPLATVKTGSKLAAICHAFLSPALRNNRVGSGGLSFPGYRFSLPCLGPPIVYCYLSCLLCPK